MCSSKHLDRTRSGPGSEQIRRVNSILEARCLKFSCFKSLQDLSAIKNTKLCSTYDDVGGRFTTDRHISCLLSPILSSMNYVKNCSKTGLEILHLFSISKVQRCSKCNLYLLLFWFLNCCTKSTENN